jgi:hypothetical protein
MKNACCVRYEISVNVKALEVMKKELRSGYIS